MAGSPPLFPQISSSQAGHDVTANANFGAVSPAGLFGINQDTTAALSLGLLGGCLQVAGVPTQIANWVGSLTASTTNYVKSSAAGVPSVVTSIPSGWPGPLASGVIALYTIVTSSTGISSASGSIIDHRSPLLTTTAGAGMTVPTGTGFPHITSGAEDSAAVAIDLSGAHATGILAAARFPALTGDVTTVAGAVATTLATSGVSAASYGSASAVATFTVDAKGRLTTASSTTIAISSGAVSGLGTAATLASSDLIHADGSVAFSADQSLGSHKLTNVTDPSSAQDAATKAYADALAVNLGKRARVRAATIANITIATALNNGDTLDGVALVTSDLVLVKDQAAPAANGVYVVGVSPARDAQFDTYDEHPGSLLAVEEGSTNADTLWLCTSNVGGTINSTALVFSTLSVSAAITQLTGDGTAGPGSGSQAFTLATVNGNVGSFGDATHVAQITVNAKGLITAAANVAITPAAVASDPVSNSFRLSLSTGTPVPSTDVTSAATIYACTYKGNSIGLYDGAQWNIRTSAQFSLALGTLAAAFQAYDVFCYDNAGTPTLESLEWQNGTATMTVANPCVVTWTGAGVAAEDPIVLTTSGAIPAPLSVNTRYYASNISGSTFNLTTSPGGTPINTTGGSQSGTHTAHCALRRQTALAYQDGILVKSGTATRRYLGTFYANATTSTEMSVGGTTTEVGGKFFLWNYYHRVARHLYVQDFTDSWSQNTTSTWRVANGQVANAGAAPNAIEFFVGLVEDVADATLVVVVTAGSTGAGSSQLAIGFNTRLVPGGLVAGAYGTTLTITTRRSEFPRLGYNYFSWLERATQSGTTTWFGDNAGAGFQSGMVATIFG